MSFVIFWVVVAVLGLVAHWLMTGGVTRAQWDAMSWGAKVDFVGLNLAIAFWPVSVLLFLGQMIYDHVKKYKE